MRTLINKETARKAYGKWVIELEHGDELKMRINDNFWLEKRISFVSILSPHLLASLQGKNRKDVKEGMFLLSGIHYSHGLYSTEEFVDKWNGDVEAFIQGLGEDESKERYLRLLTNKELNWLNEHLKTMINN